MVGNTSSLQQGRRHWDCVFLAMLNSNTPNINPTGHGEHSPIPTHYYQRETNCGTKNPSRLSTAHALPIGTTKSGAGHHCREDELRQKPNVNVEIHNQDLTWYDYSAKVCADAPDASQPSGIFAHAQSNNAMVGSDLTLPS